MVKTCIICGSSVHADDVRRSSSARRQNIILMASLSLGGEIERSSVDALVDNACTDNKFFCHTHLVTAAQYISAEMGMAGRRFSHFEDPSAWASTAYVTLADIPPHLVEAFNEMNNKDNLVITERDVCTFLNNALRKYHGTPLWPERPEEKMVCDEGTSGMETTSASGAMRQPNLYDALHSSTSAKPFDYVLDASDSVCYSSPSHLHVAHPEQKGPVAQGQYYLSKGEKLMQLFRFCPECGQRLLSTKLTAAGTAAIVKGNVALSVAAITTGLRYAELERWARQLKLSFLSKAAFLKMLEWTRPAAEHVYCDHLTSLVDEVQAYYKEGGSFSFSSNAAYDGLGYSSPNEEKVLDDACTYPILSLSLQRDFCKANSNRGSTICFSKRALDKYHCDPRTFYPITTHPVYALMASMHANSLRLSKLKGRKKKLESSNLSRKSKVDLNSREEHEWRNAIFREVLRRRLKALEGNDSSNPILYSSIGQTS